MEFFQFNKNKNMINEIFRNYGHDCIYFNLSNNGNLKTLENKVNIKVVIPDDEEYVLLMDKYLNGINPKNGDILYLTKNLYEIKNITKKINGTYKTIIEKYEQK